MVVVEEEEEQTTVVLILESAVSWESFHATAYMLHMTPPSPTHDPSLTHTCCCYNAAAHVMLCMVNRAMRKGAAHGMDDQGFGVRPVLMA